MKSKKFPIRALLAQLFPAPQGTLEEQILQITQRDHESQNRFAWMHQEARRPTEQIRYSKPRRHSSELLDIYEES